MECLNVNQLIDVVFLCEALNELVFALIDSLFYVVSHAGVKRSRPVGHNVNVVLPVCVHDLDNTLAQLKTQDSLRYPDSSLHSE